MGDLQRRALQQGVAGLIGRDLDLQAPVTKAQAEGQAGQSRWEVGCEAEGAVAVAHPVESGDGGDPDARQRRVCRPWRCCARDCRGR